MQKIRKQNLFYSNLIEIHEAIAIANQSKNVNQ